MEKWLCLCGSSIPVSARECCRQWSPCAISGLPWENSGTNVAPSWRLDALVSQKMHHLVLEVTELQTVSQSVSVFLSLSLTLHTFLLLCPKV